MISLSPQSLFLIAFKVYIIFASSFERLFCAPDIVPVMCAVETDF